jgi:hypothetical protein
VTGRHILVVAWWFPPLAGGGVHRPLHFVRHLVRRGFRVTVLTGVPPRGERRDDGLLAQVPGEARIVRAPLKDPFRAWDALKRWSGIASAAPRASNGAAAPTAADGNGARPRAARWRDVVSEALALPDRWLAWIPVATAQAALALRGDEPDLIFSTSPPHSAHLVGVALRGLFSAPLVVDFRDPWIGNPFRVYASERGRRLDAALERRVVGEAAQIVLNTPALERAFRRRHDVGARARTIPNGFDPEAFADLPPPAGGGTPGAVEIAHWGQLYGLRSGRFLLQALARLRTSDPDAYARTRVVFRGSIDGEPAFRAQAAALGIVDALDLAGSLPHAQALARQRASDVLLLLGPEHEDPEVQVPAKLYEYLAARRPILSLSRAGGAIEEILRLADVPFERAEPDDPDAIAAALARVVRRRAAPAADGDAVSAGVAAFRYDRLADRLVECFEDAWAARPARR